MISLPFYNNAKSLVYKNFISVDSVSCYWAIFKRKKRQRVLTAVFTLMDHAFSLGIEAYVAQQKLPVASSGRGRQKEMSGNEG